MAVIVNKFYFDLMNTYLSDLSSPVKIEGGSNLSTQIRVVSPRVSDSDVQITITNEFGNDSGWLSMVYLGTETIESGDYAGETWNVWYYNVQSEVLAQVTRVNASNVDIAFRWREQDSNYIGAFTTTTQFDASGYEGAISTELLAEYTEATDEQWVLVTDSELESRSFEYDAVAGSWSDVGFARPIYPVIYTGILPSGTISVTPVVYASESSLTNSQIIIITAWLNDITDTLVSIENNLKDTSDGAFDATADNEWSSDKRIAEHLLSYMAVDDYDTDSTATSSVKYARNLGTTAGSISYAEQLAKNALLNQGVRTGDNVTFASVTTENATTRTVEIPDIDVTGNSVYVTYKHTDGINYQVTQIKYPDGRIAPINEKIDVNYCNESGATIEDGYTLASKGGSVGNQASGVISWTGDPDAAGFVYSRNFIGVATVGSVAVNAKSKATQLGIVSGIPEANLYASGTAYAEGQTLYAYEGRLTNVRPDKPYRQIKVGCIINKTGTVYDVFVCPEIFDYLDELSNVSISSAANRDIMVFDSSDDLWKNSNLDTELASVVKSVTMNSATYVVTITYWDDSTDTIDLPTESSIVNISYDNATKDLAFTLRSGATTNVPLDDIITGLATETYVDDADALKVDKTTTIAGVDLHDSISKSELQTAIDYGLKMDKNISTFDEVLEAGITGSELIPVYQSEIKKITVAVLTSYITNEGGLIPEIRGVDEETISYREDGLVREVSGSNVVTTPTYDQNGVLLKITETYSLDGKTYETSFTRNEKGQITNYIKEEVI
jgi:hypothetical protein